MYVQANAVKEKHARELAEMRRLKAQATTSIQVFFIISCLSFSGKCCFRVMFFSSNFDPQPERFLNKD
jgi:hypothetical protein